MRHDASLEQERLHLRARDTGAIQAREQRPDGLVEFFLALLGPEQLEREHQHEQHDGREHDRQHPAVAGPLGLADAGAAAAGVTTGAAVHIDVRELVVREHTERTTPSRLQLADRGAPLRGDGAADVGKVLEKLVVALSEFKVGDGVGQVEFLERRRQAHAADGRDRVAGQITGQQHLRHRSKG